MVTFGRRHANAIVAFTTIIGLTIGAIVRAGEPGPAEATQQALLEAAGEQYAAYAELLNLMTADGTLPLFDQRLDLGEEDPQQAAANYRKLNEVTKRLARQREKTIVLLDQLSEQVSARPAVGCRQSASPYHLCSLMASDVFISGWKFFRWPSNAQRRSRVDVLGVAFADPAKNSSSDSQMALMRKRIYEQAKSQFGDRADIGDSEIQFYRNLRDGKLDGVAGEIHGVMLQDTSNFGIDYIGISNTQRKRPIDIVYREACEGLEHGIALNVAVSTLIVQGGMPGGDKFIEGVDKAKDAMEKAKELEDGCNQLKKDIDRAKTDPGGLIRDKIKGSIIDRAKEFVQEKLKLDDSEADLISEHIGQGLEEVDHYIDFDDKIRDAYKIDDLSKREKRLREIYKAGRSGDWGAVAVNLTGRSPKNPAPSTLTVWEKDGQLKVTYSPDPASAGGEILIPEGAKAVVGALTKDGRIRAITDEPLTVESGKTADVQYTPDKLRRIADDPPDKLRRIRDESLDAGDEGVDWSTPVVDDEPGVDWNHPKSSDPVSTVAKDDHSDDKEPAGGILDRYRSQDQDAVDWGPTVPEDEPGSLVHTDSNPSTDLPETPVSSTDVYRPNGRQRIDFQYSPRTVDGNELAERLQNRRIDENGHTFFQMPDFVGLKVKPFQKASQAETEKYWESEYLTEPWIYGGMYRIVKQGTARVWYDENQNGEQDAGEGFREEPYWIWYEVFPRAGFHGWQLSREKPECCYHALGYVDRVRKDRNSGEDSTRNRSERIHIRGTEEAYAVTQTSTTSGISHERYFVAATCGAFDLGAHIDVQCQIGRYTFPFGNEHELILKCWEYVEQADEIQKEIAFYATGREDIAKEIVEAMTDAAKGYIDYSRGTFLFTIEDRFELPGFSWPYPEKDEAWLRQEMNRTAHQEKDVHNGGATYKQKHTYGYSVRCYEADVSTTKWDDVLTDVMERVDEKPSNTETSIQVNIPGADEVMATRNKPKSWIPTNHGQRGVPFYTIQEAIEFRIDNVLVHVHGYGIRLTERQIATEKIAQELARRIIAAKGKNRP